MSVCKLTEKALLASTAATVTRIDFNNFIWFYYFLFFSNFWCSFIKFFLYIQGLCIVGKQFVAPKIVCGAKDIEWNKLDGIEWHE